MKKIDEILKIIESDETIKTMLSESEFINKEYKPRCKKSSTCDMTLKKYFESEEWATLKAHLEKRYAMDIWHKLLVGKNKVAVSIYAHNMRRGD